MDNDKKTMDMLYGKRIVINPMLYIGFILILLCVMLLGIVTGVYYYCDAMDEFIYIAIPLYLFVFAILVYYIYVIIRNDTKKYENKFRFLFPEQQKEVIELARHYRGRNDICLNEHYVYGCLENVKKPNSRFSKSYCFEYIPLEEIAWVHLLEAQTPVTTSAPDAGNTPYRKTEKYCIYTYKGECYRGIADKNFMDKLKDAMNNASLSCKFGYSKELVKKFENIKHRNKK